MKIKAGWIIAIIIILIALVFVGSTWSIRQNAVAMESQIDGKFAANKSNYDKMWKSFKEMAQVTELQAKQMKDVYMGLIQGRNQDTNLLMKMVTEDNPKMEPGLYNKLMDHISSGRNAFDNNQKQIADIVQQYNTYIRQHIIMTAITGRKPMDINKFIVTSERTDEAFSSGQDDIVDLSGK
jgi:hypothetical protein